jgi:hypothetical protein
MSTECKGGEMHPEYDFSDGIRGKYNKWLTEGSNVVVLEKDVAEMFPDSATVNEALRALAGIIRSQQAKHSTGSDTST